MRNRNDRSSNPITALIGFALVLVWIVAGSTGGTVLLTLAAKENNVYLIVGAGVVVLLYLASLLYGGD